MSRWPWHVTSPTGQVHQVKLREGRALGECICGAVFLDIFATREYGLAWPRTERELTCKNCIRIAKSYRAE